ncbi:MAG: hypothetical protein GF400_02830 [Candidatus Eisenbacteria bacterium]|nr:hypothetical protein [Candidatus Eisenbacteria bacterium]
MRLAILLVFVLAVAASAAPVAEVAAPAGAGCEWVAVKGIDVAWSQELLQDGGWAIASQLASDYPFYAEAADDFLCGDGRPVVAVEWWGAYWNPGAPPYADGFVVRFYANDTGGGLPKPGELLFEQTCFDFVEEVLPDQTWWYHYYCALDPPFEQAAGETYWLSVQAVYPWYEGGQWGWGECVSGDYWGGEAVYVFDALGIDEWAPVSSSDPYEHRECAFVLYKDEISPVEQASWTRIKGLFR